MSNLYDLRDSQSKQRTHPLADNNVVVVDPDNGEVFDPRQGYSANQLPAKDLMVVPRTTWYADTPPEDDVVIVLSTGDVVTPGEEPPPTLDADPPVLILPRLTWC